MVLGMVWVVVVVVVWIFCATCHLNQAKLLLNS